MHSSRIWCIVAVQAAVVASDVHTTAVADTRLCNDCYFTYDTGFIHRALYLKALVQYKLISCRITKAMVWMHVALLWLVSSHMLKLVMVWMVLLVHMMLCSLMTLLLKPMRWVSSASVSCCATKACSVYVLSHVCILSYVSSILPCLLHAALGWTHVQLVFCADCLWISVLHTQLLMLITLQVVLNQMVLNQMIVIGWCCYSTDCCCRRLWQCSELLLLRVQMLLSSWWTWYG